MWSRSIGGRVDADVFGPLCGLGATIPLTFIALLQQLDVVFTFSKRLECHVRQGPYRDRSGKLYGRT